MKIMLPAFFVVYMAGLTALSIANREAATAALCGFALAFTFVLLAATIREES